MNDLLGLRYDNSSVIIEWTESAGTTQYSLFVGFPNGTIERSINFTAPADEYIISNLVGGVMYRFTVYVGNDYGIDFSNGPYTDASTSSKSNL